MKLALACSLVQLIAIFLFLYGFFPPKTSIDITDHTGLDENFLKDELKHSKDGVKNLVLMVIDAFGERFLFDSKAMKFTRNMISEGRCKVVRAHVQTPTVTLPRLKAMVAGIVPNYMDVILNFASVEFTDDNWLYRLKEHNKKIVFYGDDTWLKMFPNRVFEERSEGTVSFFVNDYTEVDNNVTRHLDFELTTEGMDSWNALILHYIGLDHIGHSMHGKHPQLEIKLDEMDSIVERLFEKLSQNRKPDEFSLVVLGDHGMTEGGNHGGPSDLETHVPIVMCPSFAQTPERMNEVKPAANIEQVDLVPTLATLLKVPVPVNNIGVSFYDLWTSSPVDGLRSVLQNAIQLQNLLLGIKADVSLDRLQTCIGDSSQVLKSSNVDQDRIAGISQRCKVALKDCQDAVISSASYKDHYFLASLALSLGSLIVFVFTTFDLHLHLGHLMIFLQAISIFSSSFTEEEQDTWYFVLPSLLLYELFLVGKEWNLSRKSKSSSNYSKVLRKAVILFAMIIAQRYARSLTEFKRRRWELFPTYKTFNFTSIDECIDEFIGFVNLEILKTITEFPSLLFTAIFLVHSTEKAQKLVKSFTCISFMAISLVKWGNFEESTNLYLCHFTWLCIFLLFVQKKFKLAFATWLFLVCRSWTYPVLILMHLTGYFLPYIGSKMEIAIVCAAMASSFFFVGNSNSLSAIDISVGYTGLQSYLPLLVGIQILLNAYSGPIMMFLGWYDQKQENPHEAKKSLIEILVYRHLAVCISMISLFIQRYHLFLWRVFAPKFLFESVHYMLYLLFFVLIFIFEHLRIEISQR